MTTRNDLKGKWGGSARSFAHHIREAEEQDNGIVYAVAHCGAVLELGWAHDEPAYVEPCQRCEREVKR